MRGRHEINKGKIEVCPFEKWQIQSAAFSWQTGIGFRWFSFIRKIFFFHEKVQEKYANS